MAVTLKHPNGTTHTVAPDSKAAKLIRQAQAAAGSQAPTEQEGPPAESAKKAELVDYAVSQGADRDEAKAMTKAQLVEAYG